MENAKKLGIRDTMPIEHNGQSRKFELRRLMLNSQSRDLFPRT